MTGLSWRHVDYALKQWGRWVWLYGQGVGSYPRQSSNIGLIERALPFSWFRVRQLTAKGSGTRSGGSHRILCENVRVMPDFISRVNHAVGALPEGQYNAVIIRYATGLDINGNEYSKEQQAFVLEITTDALEDRLKEARKKIGRYIANMPGRKVRSSYSQKLSPKAAV